jgi:hypothetical protein
MKARRRAEGTGEYEPRGWCLGSEEFRQELLAQVSEMAIPKDGGEEVRQSALAKAQRAHSRVLGSRGVNEGGSVGFFEVQRGSMVGPGLSLRVWDSTGPREGRQ